jgi:hypothetical protein
MIGAKDDLRDSAEVPRNRLKHLAENRLLLEVRYRRVPRRIIRQLCTSANTRTRHQWDLEVV